MDKKFEITEFVNHVLYRAEGINLSNAEQAIVNKPSLSDHSATQPTEGTSEMEVEKEASANNYTSPATAPEEPFGTCSIALPAPINIESTKQGTATMSDQIDLGVIVQDVNGSWNRLTSVVQKIPDDKKKQYLTNHFKPLPGSLLHSHPVTKNGKTWNVSFQLRRLEQFPWLSYSRVVSGGICRYCILFPEKPGRGEGLGRYNRSGVLILSPYQGSYYKALGKDGVLVCHNQTVMHCRAAERADLFLRNFLYASERIDSRLLKQSDQLADDNRHILCQIICAVEFLAKQGLPFWGHGDCKVDCSCEDTNRSNFLATLQLMAKGDDILSKHLCSAKMNAKYTSKPFKIKYFTYMHPESEKLV